MPRTQQQDKLRVLHNSQAFNQSEADWFAAFENSIDLWDSVDALFPDDQKKR